MTRCTHPAGKGKLSTTPYNVKRTHEEFPFIRISFIPSGTRVDVTDYEGGPQTQTIPTLTVHLRRQQMLVALKKLPIAYALGFRRQASKLHLELRQRRVSRRTRKMMSQRETHLAKQTTIKGVVFTLRFNTNPQLRHHFEANKTAENQEEFSDEESRKPRYLLSCRSRGYCEHHGTSLLCPSDDLRHQILEQLNGGQFSK